MGINEYYAIQKLSGRGYKVFCIVRLMTKEGKADEDGWVHLSYGALSNKLNIPRSNIVVVVSELDQFPELIEVGRDSKGNKFRVTKELL